MVSSSSRSSEEPQRATAFHYEEPPPRQEVGAGADERRRRLYRAALELVAEGGFDALQVRALTQTTGISSKTMYKLFPSKESLLISAITEQASTAEGQLFGSDPSGGTPQQRVLDVVGGLTEAMIATPKVVQALFRALLCGKPEVADLLRRFADALTSMLLLAMDSDPVEPRDLVVADVLESVWFSAIVGWVTGCQEASYVLESMARATAVILPDAEERSLDPMTRPRSLSRPAAGHPD